MTEIEKKQAIKYQNPKILLVDFEEEARNLLMDAGYNVKSASLGFPYRVSQKDSLFPLQSKIDFPFDYQEQDIIVMNMFKKVHLRSRAGEIINEWLVNHRRGYIDPRPLTTNFSEKGLTKF